MNGDAEKGQYRIFIVDDHPVFCLGMTQLINKEADLEVIGSEETAAAAIEVIEKMRPDLVIVDISLKDSDGIDLVREIGQRQPDLPMLVLSMYYDSL